LSRSGTFDEDRGHMDIHVYDNEDRDRVRVIERVVEREREPRRSSLRGSDSARSDRQWREAANYVQRARNRERSVERRSSDRRSSTYEYD
jgi:hypothetical protein